MSEHDDEHRERLQTSYADWLKHRAVLEAHRARSGDRRTPPPPPCNISKHFSELAGRSITTTRLHPRYGDEPFVDASKLGGTFLWPAREPWPICPAHGVPLVTVLQLRADDFHEMPFPPGADLFQMLWCPREHTDVRECREMPCPMSWADPRFFWRNRREIGRSRADNPPPQEAYYDYVPFPCRLLPERVIEYPSVYDLSEDVRRRIDEWLNENVGPNEEYPWEYEAELSVAYGTKIGGYVHWIQYPWEPTCECDRPMEHLLTIATVEWNGVGDRRCTPVEEQTLFASFPGKWDDWDEKQKATWDALWNSTGLNLGDAGQMQLFVCRHCGRWPVLPSVECH